MKLIALLFVIASIGCLSCKSKSQEKIKKRILAQKEIFDPGIVVKVKDGKVTAELATISRDCLNPVTHALTKMKDTTIIINVVTGKTAGY